MQGATSLTSRSMIIVVIACAVVGCTATKRPSKPHAGVAAPPRAQDFQAGKRPVQGFCSRIDPAVIAALTGGSTVARRVAPHPFAPPPSGIDGYSCSYANGGQKAFRLQAFRSTARGDWLYDVVRYCAVVAGIEHQSEPGLGSPAYFGVSTYLTFAGRTAACVLRGDTVVTLVSYARTQWREPPAAQEMVRAVVEAAFRVLAD